MALVNLATLWPVKKKEGKLKLAGDSKDGTHTYMLFQRKSKDGKYTMYDLCEKVDDAAVPPTEGESEEAAEAESDLPF